LKKQSYINNVTCYKFMLSYTASECNKWV
jgi:hypothetical protein